jgi:2-polyprenyl-6-methoxyphenol hydroxylase-like FAD-dependent oxidoreductase
MGQGTVVLHYPVALHPKVVTNVIAILLGCNASFEDVRVLDEIIAEHLGSAGSNEQVPWERIFAQYETSRKPNADAIADIALENYIEMRDKVADQNFQFRQTVRRDACSSSSLIFLTLR